MAKGMECSDRAKELCSSLGRQCAESCKGVIRVRPNPEVDEQIRRYVRGIEAAHERAEGSSLRFGAVAVA